jgi:peroxiredoxin
MSEGFAIGEGAPALELPDTEGDMHSLPDTEGAPATVVIWTCNHCPYARAWHDRIAAAARDYADRRVRFLAVNSNDAERYPADSLEEMRKVARGQDWPFPYLYDSSQDAARAWNALTTPHLYVVDPGGRIRYEGAADEDHKDPAAGAAWLREALDAVLAGEEPERPSSELVGCSIKWK